jgi:hypothetical protein
MRFGSPYFRRSVAALLWLTVLTVACNQATAQVRPSRQPLPVSVLLSAVAPLPTSAATAEYARQSEVRWSDADLRARPFGVRHRVDFFPDTSFELVFDTRLNTSRDAVSYAGYAVNHPGSVAVLTQFKGLIKLTVDSPTRGHYSVHPQPDGRYIAREYTGEGAKYEPDDFDGPEAHLAYTNQVLAEFDSGAIAAFCREPSASPELDALLQEKASVEAEIAGLLIATAATGIAAANTNDRPPDTAKPPGTVKPPECIATATRPCDVRTPVGVGGARPPAPEAPSKPKEERSGFSFSIGGFGFGGGRGGQGAHATQGGRGGGFDIGTGIQMVVLVAQLASKKSDLNKIDEKIEAIRRTDPTSAACTAQIRTARANHERVQRWLQREIAKAGRARVGASTLPSTVPTGSMKIGEALAALDAATFVQIAQVTSDAARQSPAGQSIRRAALPDMNVDSVDIDSSCSDSSGSIKLAVVVSQKVMAKAGRTPEEVKILNIEIIHGLDITNAALRGSNISTPGIDAGFELANVQSEPLAMDISYDVKNKFAVKSVFDAYWPPNATAESQAFYDDIDKVAPNADVVLVLIDGDASFAMPRGMAFGTKNISGDRATNRRLAVVKHRASVAEYFYTFAHELGHTLGAGHDEADPKYQSFARGAVVKSGKQRWASLMALSQCPDGESTPSEKNTCRRVPYYSSAGLSYPGYSATLLGDADKDNASAMRLIRDNVTRLRCSQPREASVWLQKGAAPDPLLRAQAWEAESIWIRPELDPRWRYPYAHLPAAAGADAFVNVMLHNATQNSANSQLQVWRAKPAKGLLLSPRWDDMERVDQAQCATPANGRVTLAQAATTIVQVPCASGPATALEFGRDSWALRWDDGANPPAGLINDTIPQQPLTAWRSMRNVALALEQPTAQTVLVRKRAASESRQVNIRIEPAANQYNFSVRDSGLTEVRYARSLCRNPSKPECVALAGRTDAVAAFDGATMTIELSLPPDEEVPIRLFFKRTPNVPQQNVLLRVFEEEIKVGSSSSPPETKIVGGTSFIVRHAPGDVTKAK